MNARRFILLLMLFSLTSSAFSDRFAILVGVGDYDSLPILTAATVDAGEEDWFSFTLDRTGVVGDLVVLQAEGDLALTLVDEFDAEISSAIATAGQTAKISVNGLAEGDYFVKVSAAAAVTGYEVFLISGAPAAFQSGELQLGVDRTDPVHSPSRGRSDITSREFLACDLGLAPMRSNQ